MVGIADRLEPGIGVRDRAEEFDKDGTRVILDDPFHSVLEGLKLLDGG